jgi:hypothetical protein
MCDGDYPQIEVILGELLEFDRQNNIEFMKHSSACSLWQQAMDLCKGFWLWREKITKPPTSQVPFEDLPYYCKLAWTFLKKHGMDKASIQLYVQNYIARIAPAFGQCFNADVMRSGWERSSIYPFSMHGFLRSCPYFYNSESWPEEKINE